MQSVLVFGIVIGFDSLRDKLECASRTYERNYGDRSLVFSTTYREHRSPAENNRHSNSPCACC